MTRTASGRRDALRTFNKHVLNPVMLLLAGRRYWYAAALHHTGRRSGREYTTPIVAQPVTDGFVIPLPYGTGVDWLRNIRAAGRASLDVHGRHYLIADPRIVDAHEAFPMIPARLRRTWARFGIESYLLVRTVPGDEQP